jgi:hypothetical protein
MTAPYLPRGWDTGPNEDPLAALIGKGLQAFGAVKTARQQEADRQQRLQREDAQERDTRDWRDLQSGIALSNAGLTTQAPPTAPVVTPQAGSRVAGLDAGLGQTPDITPGPPPNPVERLGGISLYRAGPSAAEQKATVTDDRQRVIHRRVGHALAQQMFGHDVDEDTAEGIGTNPAAFSSFQKASDRNIDPLSPLGIERSAQRAHDESAARITPKQKEQAQFGAAALAGWVPVERLRMQYPQVEAEVGQIMASPAFVQAIPGFRSSADMVRVLKTAGASDAAQRYLRAKWNFLDNIVRTRVAGGRMSGDYLLQVRNEFVPSLDPAANVQIRQNELRSILSAAGEAGYDPLDPAASGVWNRAAKLQGVDNVDIQAALKNQPWDTRVRDIQSRHPGRP